MVISVEKGLSVCKWSKISLYQADGWLKLLKVKSGSLNGSENQFNATGSNGGDSSIAGFNLTASF